VPSVSTICSTRTNKRASRKPGVQTGRTIHPRAAMTEKALKTDQRTVPVRQNTWRDRPSSRHTIIRGSRWQGFVRTGTGLADRGRTGGESCEAGGETSGGSRTQHQGAAQAAVDWRELLRRLWSDTVPADYSWMRPNRRHVWAGLYLPGAAREGVGEIAIAVDCSGSVSARQLGLFEAEIRSILEGQRPQRTHVMYFDALIQKVDIYEAGQPIQLQPKGGGGTDFRPCFQWLDENRIVPQTLVFLTDLDGAFPGAAPAYPVLLASTESRHAPFGQGTQCQCSSMPSLSIYRTGRSPSRWCRF